MRIVLAQDPDKHKREIGQKYMADFYRWHMAGHIGETYKLLAEKAKLEVRGWNFIKSCDFDDIAHDAALTAWKRLANRHHSDPMHLYNEIALCLKQQVSRCAVRSSLIRTFGSKEELAEMGFNEEDDGGIDKLIFRLDLSHKLKHDLEDFRGELAAECLVRQILTIREIQEYAGFSQAQAREIKAIMTTFMEEYCAIS